MTPTMLVLAAAATPAHSAAQHDCACSRLDQYLRATSGRLAFVHITKTGGTSIEHAFNLSGSCHSTANAMRSCDHSAFERALSFAIIRHPLDRAISLYDYTRGGGNGSPNDRAKWRWVVDAGGFAQFVERFSSDQAVRDSHFRTQTDFVYHNGELLVDALLCLEGIDDELLALQLREPRLATILPSVPHLRVSRRSVDDFGLRLLRQLDRVFADDFQLWYTHCRRYAQNASRAERTPPFPSRPRPGTATAHRRRLLGIESRPNDHFVRGGPQSRDHAFGVE